MTAKPHPDDLKAVLEANRPKMLAVAKAIQNAIADERKEEK